MGITGFVFEILAAKAKIWPGVFAGLSCCHGNFLRLKNDQTFFSNIWCLIWYHNIAVESLRVVMSILLIRRFLSSVKTGLSHLKPLKGP